MVALDVAEFVAQDRHHFAFRQQVEQARGDLHRVAVDAAGVGVDFADRFDIQVGHFVHVERFGGAQVRFIERGVLRFAHLNARRTVVIMHGVLYVPVERADDGAKLVNAFQQAGGVAVKGVLKFSGG